MNIGRPRKLEPEAILEIAMGVFWEKGYEATSIADILRATGLHKGSLYQTFADKKSLFIACLEFYQSRFFKKNADIINSEEDPIKGLKKSLYDMILSSCSSNDSDDSCNRGCMAVNTLVETAPHDYEILAVLEKNENRFQSYMIGILEKAQSEYGYQLKFPPEVIFSMLMTFMCGVRSVIKNMISVEEGYALIDTQLQLLGL
ncbi:MAG: TetR/AcrR family transcriptional regulator [Proteobacteria bacterium]|nr:TetR/AcrR family transcriptional regulator [Pseudomonadota bacterium]